MTVIKYYLSRSKNIGLHIVEKSKEVEPIAKRRISRGMRFQATARQPGSKPGYSDPKKIIVAEHIAKIENGTIQTTVIQCRNEDEVNMDKRSIVSVMC